VCCLLFQKRSPPAETLIHLVPELDVLFAIFPTEIDFTSFFQVGKIDESVLKTL
jgi:hypothetical protein